MSKGFQSNPISAIAERLRSDPEAVRKLFVQAGIYTEEGNLREAFGGTMNKEKPMPERFNLEAAKKGADILWNGEPAKFLLHVPEAVESWRVLVLFEGLVVGTHENGGAHLTMAPRKEKTVGYRAYYRIAAGRGGVLKDVAWERFADVETFEQTPGFIRWIDTEWQYDEVEL